MMRNLVLFFLFISGIGYSQTLKINITNLRSSAGSIVLAFYNTQESFSKEEPLFRRTVSKATFKNGIVSVTYTDIKPGTYGIAMLDDENGNIKMDYGLILPKEGFGFSEYWHTGLTKPTLDKFDFILKNEPKTVEIKVKYM